MDDATCPHAEPGTGAPVTGEGEWEGARVEVILHLDRGSLHMIEIFRPDGGQTHGLPSPTALTYF